MPVDGRELRTARSKVTEVDTGKIHTWLRGMIQDCVTTPKLPLGVFASRLDVPDEKRNEWVAPACEVPLAPVITAESDVLHVVKGIAPRPDRSTIGPL